MIGGWFYDNVCGFILGLALLTQRELRLFAPQSAIRHALSLTKLGCDENLPAIICLCTKFLSKQVQRLIYLFTAEFYVVFTDCENLAVPGLLA